MSARRIAFLIAGGLVAASVAVGMAGCAPPSARPDSPRSDSPSLTWTAAIGRLDDTAAVLTCSATLVAPDVIVTAAHCLFADGRKIDPASLIFRPNLGAAALPPARGRSIIALGNDEVDPWRLEEMPTETDWALIRIDPPITSVPPLPVGAFTVTEIDRHLAAGARLSQAGYGAYGLSAGTRLSQRINCRPVEDDDLTGEAANRVLATDCRVDKGDSGGPMILTDVTGNRYLVGIISGYRQTDRIRGRIGFGAVAANFGRHLPAQP